MLSLSIAEWQFRVLDYARSGTRVTDAWISASLLGWNTPYAILVRNENFEDFIEVPVASAVRTLTRDIRSSNGTFRYYYYNGDMQWLSNPALSHAEKYQAVGEALRKAVQWDDTVAVKSYRSVEAELPIPPKALLANLHGNSQRGMVQLAKPLNYSTYRKPERARNREELAQRLETIGFQLRDPEEIEFSGFMIAHELSIDSNKRIIWAPNGAVCHGEFLTILNPLDNAPVVNEQTTVIMQGNEITQVRRAAFLHTRGSDVKVRKPSFRTVADPDASSLRIELVYRVYDGFAKPLWLVRYDQLAYFLDGASQEWIE
jgi:hypothetical protein